LNPQFSNSIYTNLDDAQNEHLDETFNWEMVVLNMSSISKSIFKTPIENQLGKPLSQKKLPFIARRYVFTRIMNALKGKSEVIAAVGVGTTVTTAIVAEYMTYVRHKENLESNKSTVESQHKLAQSQEKMALEMKRANDLKQQEGLATVNSVLPEEMGEKIKAPSLVVEEIDFCVYVLHFFFFQDYFFYFFVPKKK